jgi:hypothetical protein
MSRLYDRILTDGLNIPKRPSGDETATSVLHMLKYAEVVSADNVAEYYFEKHTKEICDWQIEDFPNVAPTFRNLFIEFQLSPVSDQQKALLREIGAAGVLMMAYDLRPDVEEFNPFTDAAIGYPRPPLDARWGVSSITIIESKTRSSCSLVSNVLYYVREDGLIVPPEGQNKRFSIYPIFTADVLPNGHQDDQSMLEFCGQFNVLVLYPALLTLSFMHCKNVVVEDRQPPRRDRRRQDKSGASPFVTYKVLNIRPMQEVLRHEGQIERTGLKRALHICRGHFADYTEGNGLFGRIHGRFWIEAHTRGSAKSGVVVKDYDVKQPKEKPR